MVAFPPSFKWTREHNDALFDLAAKGYSSGEIARLMRERFGVARTRSAICGQAKRKGVRLRGKPPGRLKGHGGWRWGEGRRGKMR